MLSDMKSVKTKQRKPSFQLSKFNVGSGQFLKNRNFQRIPCTPGLGVKPTTSWSLVWHTSVIPPGRSCGLWLLWHACKQKRQQTLC